jgi:hypothetical protein
MRKLVLGGSALVALGLTACTPAATTEQPAATPGSQPSVVVSAPDSNQLKEMIRSWTTEGGDKVEVPLVVDLQLSHANWKDDEIKRKLLTSSVVKDTKAAMAYKPVPDDQMQKHWVDLLGTMKQVGDNLSVGNYDAAQQGFQDADQDYKQIYDRNQAIYNAK